MNKNCFISAIIEQDFIFEFELLYTNCKEGLSHSCLLSGRSVYHLKSFLLTISPCKSMFPLINLKTIIMEIVCKANVRLIEVCVHIFIALMLPPFF